MDKQAIRERVWDAMEAEGVARFPFPPHEAAALLADQREWDRAQTLKSNPDAPQLPVRRQALREDKTVYMAVPRLRDEQCFMALSPTEIPPEATDDAATISSADQYATQVGPAAMEPVDFVVAGSVAVTPEGDRVGKGEGYSDLEFAILREAGLVDRETTIATTVHEMQVLSRTVDTDPHDVPMDLIVTPERVIRTERQDDRPSGIDWEAIDQEMLEAIPILQRLQPE